MMPVDEKSRCIWFRQDNFCVEGKYEYYLETDDEQMIKLSFCIEDNGTDDIHEIDYCKYFCERFCIDEKCIPEDFKKGDLVLPERFEHFGEPLNSRI